MADFYRIDTDHPNRAGINPSFLIGRRLCRACRAELDPEILTTTDPDQFMAKIAECCGKKAEYLSHLSPLKETLFRIALAGRNTPMSAAMLESEVSGVWRRDSRRSADADAIAAVLNADDYYGFEKLPRSEDTDAREEEEGAAG